MKNSYTCPCGKKTRFEFGVKGSRGIKWGCDDCPHNYRMAQISEARRRRQTAEGRLRKRQCKGCSAEFRILDGPRNLTYCVDCRKRRRENRDKINVCSWDGCLSTIPRKMNYCSEHRAAREQIKYENKLNRRKRRRAARTKKQQTRCPFCPNIYDWRLTEGRHPNGRTDCCPECYAKDHIREGLGVPPNRHVKK